MKKRIVLIGMFFVLCLALVSGCASSATSQDDEQTKNRQYMSSVNTIMGTIKTDMEEFSAVVKSGETVSLSAQLSDVNKQVDALKALEVPSAMTDVQNSYVTGATELQTALNEYVTLYQNSKGGSLDSSALASIQSHYDAGIAALKTADSKVSQA